MKRSEAFCAAIAAMRVYAGFQDWQHAYEAGKKELGKAGWGTNDWATACAALAMFAEILREEERQAIGIG